MAVVVCQGQALPTITDLTVSGTTKDATGITAGEPTCTVPAPVFSVDAAEQAQADAR